MKFLKTHYGRAIPVIPSDKVNIPNPAGKGIEGVTTGVGENKLIDSTKTFTTNLLGAIVVSDEGLYANVIGVNDSSTLVLDLDIIGSGQAYAIYNSINNEGCALYIGKQDDIQDLTVLTVGGDVVTFSKCGDLNSSMILPVNVLRVFESGTGTKYITALW